MEALRDRGEVWNHGDRREALTFLIWMVIGGKESRCQRDRRMKCIVEDEIFPVGIERCGREWRFQEGIDLIGPVAGSPDESAGSGEEDCDPKRRSFETRRDGIGVISGLALAQFIVKKNSCNEVRKEAFGNDICR